MYTELAAACVGDNIKSLAAFWHDMPHSTHRHATLFLRQGTRFHDAQVHESLLMPKRVDQVLMAPPRLDKPAALWALGQTNGTDHLSLH